MEQEFSIRGFGPPEGYGAGRSGAVTSWNAEKRQFIIEFPKDYLHFQGLKIIAPDGSTITQREAEIRRHLENLRAVAETGELA